MGTGITIFSTTGSQISTQISVMCRSCPLLLQVSKFWLQDERINNRHFRSTPNFRYYYYSVRGSLFHYYLVFVQQILIIFVIVIIN